MTSEQRRYAIARRVVEIAALSSSKQDFIHRMQEEYGKLCPLGSGCSRATYALPAKLVFKVEHGVTEWDSSSKSSERVLSAQSYTEVMTAARYPEYTPRIYGSYFSPDDPNLARERYPSRCELVVIIARRAHSVGEYTCEDPRYKTLSSTFSDMSGNNLGWIGKQLMAIDPGCGAFADM